MYSRLLSGALRHAPRANALRSLPAYSNARRRLCQGSKSKPAPADVVPPAAANGTTTAPSNAAAAKPAPSVPVAPAATPAASVASPAAPAAADAVAAKPDTTPAGAGLPDVHSTSLGLDPLDPLYDDPKKWQKFAWKYLGSIVVFLVAYRAVNYYVDKLEEDGKKRRDEVEENKVLKQQFDEQEADQLKAKQMLMSAQAPGAAHLQTAGAVAGAPQQPAALFKPVQEEEGFVSELDELRTLQVELQIKIKALSQERNQTAEISDRKWALESELKDLELEIWDLEKEEAKQKAA